MRLPPSVLGAQVAYLKDIVPRGLDFPARRVLLLGICHLHSVDYKVAFQQQQRKYFPNWIGELTRTAAESRKTAVLVECPPFGADALALPSNELVKLAGVELKIANTLERVQEHFVGAGAARTADWVLDGIDLRYSCEVAGGRFVPGDKDARHSLHEDALEAVPDAWNPQPWVLEKFYAHLVGSSEDTAGLEAVAAGVKALTRGRAEERTQLLSRAAAICRSLFDGVPAPLRREVIRHLIKEGNESAERIDDASYDDRASAEREYGPARFQEGLTAGIFRFRTTDYESRPNSANTVKYVIAEQLVNLCILGHVLSPGSDVVNIVVPVGSAHVATVVRFFQSPAVKTLVKRSATGSIMRTDFTIEVKVEDTPSGLVELA